MKSTSPALLTRRRFIGSGAQRTAAAAALMSSVTLTRCAAPPADEPQPARDEHKLTGMESTAPSEALVPLDDQRLLATVKGPQGQGLAGRISEDLGKTWSEPFLYRQQGKPMEGGVYPERAAVRLQSGELGMVYYTVVKSPAGYSMRQWSYASSSDDGENWSAGSALDLPVAHDPSKGIYSAFLFGTFTQLSSGRLVVPGYWYMGARSPETPPQAPYPAHGFISGTKVGSDGHLFEGAMGGCYVYFSDDSGQSWTRSTGSIMVWPLPGEDNIGGFGAAWEPSIVELKDGSVLMLMRTNVGRLFQSVSKDGGAHWTLARPTELASGDLKCYLGRLRTTGDLVVVWNQSTTEEVLNGYSRGRLSLAISKDEGKSWENFRTIERSPGMQPIDRVESPPVKHVRPREDLGDFPEGYSRNHYPTLVAMQEKLLIANRFNSWPSGKLQRKLKLRVIPERELYL